MVDVLMGLATAGIVVLAVFIHRDNKRAWKDVIEQDEGEVDDSE